jgi:hypothetical protein
MGDNYMSVVYHIDIAHRVVFTRGYGNVVDSDLLQHNQALIADPNFDPDFNQLLDFTQVIDAEIKAETIFEIARNRIFNLGSLRAILVRPGYQYGLARMFQNMRMLEDKNIGIFLDIGEALKWLGLAE